MRGTMSGIVFHLPNVVPSKTIGGTVFPIVLHLPNSVPSKTLRTRLFYSVRHCSAFAKCSTEQNNSKQYNPDCFPRYGSVPFWQIANNEMQRYTMPPPVNDLPGSVIIIQFTHTGATPVPPPCQSHATQRKIIKNGSLSNGRQGVTKADTVRRHQARWRRVFV